MPVRINGDTLSLEDFLRVARGRAAAELSRDGVEKMRRSRRVLEELAGGSKPCLGVNTGWGSQAGRRIAAGGLRQLQANLVRSHATGVGARLDDDTTRGVMLLRANALAKGFSGVRPEVAQLLLDMLNHGIHPVLPEKGSAGAPGDRAPLAHLALALTGEGEVRLGGRIMPAARALRKAGLQPLRLLEKEGRGLLDGTQAMTAIGIFNLLDAEKLAKVADIAGALTFEAQLGSPEPFLDEIQEVRPHPGQVACARNLRQLIKNSPLWISHQGKRKARDPQSVRCIPQVHGAVRDALAQVRRTLEIEANAATEDPLVFPASRLVLSGGNAHGEPVALAMDFLAIALAGLGNIAERRIHRLVNPDPGVGLPPALIADDGLSFGFTAAHVTAAALAAENRTLAHPASVNNIPAAAGPEDFVSMGTIGARMARSVLANTKHILAIEIMAALQALDFFPLKSSPVLESVKAAVRRKVPFLKGDARMDRHMAAVAEMIDRGQVLRAAEKHGFRLL